MDKLGEWQVKRYARMMFRASEEGRDWESVDSSEGRPLLLTLTKGGVLKVGVAGLLLEYWNLPHAKDMRVLKREDSLLFLCRAKGVNRKWRVMFSGASAAVADEKCSQCLRVIHTLIQPSSASQSLPAPPIYTSQTLPAPSLYRYQPFLATQLPTPQVLPASTSLYAGIQLNHTPGSFISNQQSTVCSEGSELPRLSTSSQTSLQSTLVQRPERLKQLVSASHRPMQPHPTSSGIVSLQGSNVFLTTASSVHRTNKDRKIEAVSQATRLSNVTETYLGEEREQTSRIKKARLASLTSMKEYSNTVQEKGPSLQITPGLGDISRTQGLEEIVRAVLQDPGLPDLVDAVHKIIGNM